MLEAQTNDDQRLTDKIDCLKTSLRTVLSQEDLNKASIKTAYTTFEQEDVNRGKSFYRFYSFFHNGWYKDQKGRHHFTKFTEYRGFLN